MAAVLSCGEGALLSHHSAAWLWGISAWLAQPVEVTAPVPRHTRPELRVHSAKTLRPEDMASEQGIPVISVPRTLLDLAAESEHNLRWALPRAKRLNLLDLIEVDAMLARSKGQRGVRRLRLRLERYRRREFTRSELERLFLEVVERAGLPRPSMNMFVSGFELDAYWPELRFAVELDTYEYHGDEISFEKDRVRQEELKLAGIEMTRVTGPRLEREPARVAARLRRLLDQRRREIRLGI